MAKNDKWTEEDWEILLSSLENDKSTDDIFKIFSSANRPKKIPSINSYKGPLKEHCMEYYRLYTGYHHAITMKRATDTTAQSMEDSAMKAAKEKYESYWTKNLKKKFGSSDSKNKLEERVRRLGQNYIEAEHSNNSKNDLVASSSSSKKKKPDHIVQQSIRQAASVRRINLELDENEYEVEDEYEHLENSSPESTEILDDTPKSKRVKHEKKKEKVDKSEENDSKRTPGPFQTKTDSVLKLLHEEREKRFGANGEFVKQNTEVQIAITKLLDNNTQAMVNIGNMMAQALGQFAQSQEKQNEMNSKLYMLLEKKI
jgi:hypothetical protein